VIDKKELVDLIENSELERVPGDKDLWEKRIYLNDSYVLIVGYEEEEATERQDSEEETVKNYYWYWELRNSESWDVLFEKHEKNFSFCESQIGSYTDDDRVEDVVGDIDEADVCKWSEQDWIEDISENIADNVIHWLKTLKEK